MSFSIPSINDFKQQFVRDFPYAVPAFGAAATAALSGSTLGTVTVIGGGTGFTEAPTVVLTNQPGDLTGTGAEAEATVSQGAVSSIAVTASGTGYILPPLVSFTGGAGDDTNQDDVTDDDLEGAIFDAQFNVNPGIFASQAQFSRAFLYLAAHQLCEKLKMAAAGTQSQYSWLTKSKNVAGVGQSFEIPESISSIPFLAHMSTTRYGAMYLQIVSPLLVGNVGIAPAVTNP